jgi:acyl-CoA synthetase (NDP forming)/RimJ/RimL family protein N-acetyltransferase
LTHAFTTSLVIPAGADVGLREGGSVHIQPAEPSDAEALTRFLAELTDESRYFRFFSAGVDLAGAARSLVRAGGGLSLIAREGRAGAIVGHGVYFRERGPGNRAEVAFAIADDWQGHGLATTMLVELAQSAAAEGIEVFTAVVLPANHRMIGVFRDSGFAVTVRSAEGELHVSFSTTPTPAGAELFARHERDAAVAAVTRILCPTSVAVIGASRRRGSIGGEVLHNVVAGGFSGRLAAVNPNATEISGVRCFASITEVPWDVDLAIVTVPAAGVLAAARACADRGVRALVVISAGFSETGPDGRRREAELLAVCRASGMRMVGPNCLGVVNTDPGVALDATFSPGTPPVGRAAFASQSGAFGIAAIDLARERGLGLSAFVSLGDKADLSGNDFMQFWEADGRTDVVMLYLESFGNPRKFGRIARQLGASKPVIAVKSGRSVAGSRAASSHTGALLAASDVPVDALFAHAGVIRADTVSEMFDVAAVITGQPPPPGTRVAIVTNVGGPAIMCADACAAAGLRVEPLAEGTRDALRRELPDEVSVANPVDLIASARAADFAHAVTTVLADPEVDAVVTVFARPLAAHAAEVYAAVESAVAESAAAKPVISVFLGADTPSPPAGGSPTVPVLASVEQAARALGLIARHAAWRRAGADATGPPPGIEPDRASAIIASTLANGGPGWIPPAAAEALLTSYGIPLAESAVERTPQAAGRAASRLGGPVALKAIAPGLLHKTDAGAIALGLTSPTAVTRAAHHLKRRLEEHDHTVVGYLVQRMAPPGPELIVGVVGDPQFGPLVAVGAGGVTAELLSDVAVRLAPVGDRVAAEMLHGLRTFPLLDGFRGAPPADVASVVDVIVRVSALAAAHPEIAELDCNPVVAGTAGAIVVDARVRLERPDPPQLYGALDR